MKTDELLIREVASAICRAEGKEPASAGMKSTGIKPSGRGLMGIEWNEFMWQDYIKQAKAAILAIREFDTMEEALKDAPDGSGTVTLYDDTGNEVTKIPVSNLNLKTVA